MRPRPLAAALLSWLACSGRPAEPRRPIEVAPETAPHDAGAAAHRTLPPDARPPPATAPTAVDAAVDAAAPAIADAAPLVPQVRELPSCDELPPRSDPARWRLPRDVHGETLADLESRFGAPTCRRGSVYQWRLPRGCAYQKQVLTIWFRGGKARHAVSRREITGQHCAPTW